MTNDFIITTDNDEKVIIKTELEQNIVVRPFEEAFNILVSGEGPRGKEGPPGLPGDAGYVLPVLTTLDANKAVTVEYGYAVYATNTSINTQAVGFVKELTFPGYFAQVTTAGQLTFADGTFIPGEQLFLGEFGEVTNIPPTSGILQKVGMALDDKTLLVRVSQPVILT